MICECNGHGEIIEIFLKSDKEFPVGQEGSWPCVECNMKGIIENVSSISIRESKSHCIVLDKNVG